MCTWPIWNDGARPHELAASTLQVWGALNPGKPGLDALYRQANLKLMEKYQEFKPFKFIVYGAQAQRAAAKMEKPGAAVSLISGR